MFIETYHKGQLINRFDVGKLNMEDLEFAVIYQSSMKEEIVITETPKVNKVPVEKRQSVPVKKKVRNAPQIVPFKIEPPIVRAKPVYSNARPYDQLYED